MSTHTIRRYCGLHLVVNNARFLIFPWVRSMHLASKLLGLAARRLPKDWDERYSYRKVLLETFVEKDRFRGTSYRAANWQHLGETRGRGKLDTAYANALPVKNIWVYPLTPRFRETLTPSASSTQQCRVGEALADCGRLAERARKD